MALDRIRKTELIKEGKKVLILLVLWMCQLISLMGDTFRREYFQRKVYVGNRKTFND